MSGAEHAVCCKDRIKCCEECPARVPVHVYGVVDPDEVDMAVASAAEDTPGYRVVHVATHVITGGPSAGQILVAVFLEDASAEATASMLN